MKYQTTKIQCSKQIPANHVCEGCGHSLVPIRTHDNSGQPTYWVGCMNKWCCVFTYGVHKNQYKLARKIVKSGRIYLEDKNPHTIIYATRKKANEIKDIMQWSKQFNIELIQT